MNTQQPTKTLKLLVNQYEEITHTRLVDACRADGARVCPKVRVADALPVDHSGIPNEHFTYALKSHFDFVVVDKVWRPLFAVEFDGASHSSPDAERRDTIKNGLCERFDLPLLRVNANHLQQRFRKWDLLSYLVEIWFLKQAFYEAQEAGHVPLEEDFDPAFVLSNGSGKSWPYWLCLPAQDAIRRLNKLGQVADFAPSQLIGHDSKDNYRCLCWIEISSGRWACMETGMRSQLFDVCNYDVIWQIGIIELYERLTAVLSGTVAPQSDRELDRMISGFEGNYGPCSFSGIVKSTRIPASARTIF